MSGLAFSPDCRQLASVSYDSRRYVYCASLATGRERYPHHRFLASGDWIQSPGRPMDAAAAASSSDGVVRILGLDTAPVHGEILPSLPGHTNARCKCCLCRRWNARDCRPGFFARLADGRSRALKRHATPAGLAHQEFLLRLAVFRSEGNGTSLCLPVDGRLGPEATNIEFM